jgi:hypothetical protein
VKPATATTRATLLGTASRLALTLALCTSLVSLGALALAGDDSKAYWQGRYQEVHAEYTAASQELEAANAAYRKARQRNRLKGERREEIMSDIAKAETRYAAAKKARDGFAEEARRAGAEPGWFPRN